MERTIRVTGKGKTCSQTRFNRVNFVNKRYKKRIR